MGREVGSWMRDVWQDARKFRQCRKAKIGRDASWWDDHTCTMASGSSLRMERMVSALVTASREANNLFRKVSYCSHSPRFDAERDIPDVETSNWRAVCGKTASTVRREGRRKPSLPPITGVERLLAHHQSHNLVCAGFARVPFSGILAAAEDDDAVGD